MGNYDAIIERLKNYAMSCDEIITVLIIGSHARKKVPADKYSDLDVIIVVSDPTLFLFNDKWLEFLGSYNISFVENTIGGEKERRILFDGGLDVDFVIISKKTAEAALFSADGLQILQKGYEVLLDKSILSGKLCAKPLPSSKSSIPTYDEYLNQINDFWYHAVWTVKKVLRGELWAAKFCVDGYMKYKLLWLLELHALVTNGLDYDTWHNGRFVDSWGDKKAMEQMRFAFAHYEKGEIIKALMQTMEIFCQIALEISDKTGYSYPNVAEKSARDGLITF